MRVRMRVRVRVRVRHAVRVGAARVRVDDVLVHRVDVRLVDAHAPG